MATSGPSVGSFGSATTPGLLCISFFVILQSAAIASAGEEVKARDPVALGHEQPIDDAVGGRPRLLRTLSLDPPVFLLPGFLSEAEADDVVAMAQKTRDWETSQIQDDGGHREEFRQALRNKKQATRFLQEYDEDGDSHLSFREIRAIVSSMFPLPNLDEEDLAAFMAHALPDDPAAKRISFEKFVKAKPSDWFADFFVKHVQKRDRYSDQTWMKYEEPLLQALLKRAQAVTGLPDVVMNETEMLQVVRYPEQGHYACHHDSSPDSISAGNMRIATLGMFLNDVPRGGETGFPGADREGDWSEDDWAILETACQPTPMCTRLGGLVVPPKKGDGILWYNVRPQLLPDLFSGAKRPGQGFSGEDTVLWNSMHCGAEVLEGEKWFANLWMHLPSASRKRRSEL